MKKTACLIALILSFMMLFSISRKQAMDKWITIISEQDAQIKLSKLEEFHIEYGDQNDQMTQLIYSHLVGTSYQLTKYDKTIEYGEKALVALPNIDDQEKIKIYLALANSYYVTRKDLGQSYDYANLLIKLAKSIQDTIKGTNFKLAFIAPALRLKAKILFENLEKISESFDKAFESLAIDQSNNSINLIFGLIREALRLDRVDEAAAAYEKISSLKPDVELAKVIGYIYIKKGDDTRAMDFLKASYRVQKSAKIAYDLGILYNKIQDIDNAIKYFAESFVLYERVGNDPDNMAKAQNVLLHLYVNVKMKDVANQEERDKGYEDILAAARMAIEETNL